MCNFVRLSEKELEHKKIRKTGTGYKWMTKYFNNNTYISPFKTGRFLANTIYVWVHLYDTEGDGFTFFQSKRIAKSVKRSISHTLAPLNDAYSLVLVKIKYAGGITSRFEPDPAIQTRIGLCKEFTILEEVNS